MRKTLSLLVTVAPLLGQSQAVKQLRLAPPDIRIDPEIAAFWATREIADGRLIVSDARGQGLVALDLTTKKITPIGRMGRGPGEYRIPPIYLQALGGDTTVAMDLIGGSRNWLIIVGDQIVKTLSPAADSITKVTRAMLQWGAPTGKLFAVADFTFPSGSGEVGFKNSPDSNALIRLDMMTLRIDTIARIRPEPMRMTSTKDTDGKVVSTSFRTPQYSSRERVTVHADGWISIARIEPYRIDWLSPDGRWTHGKPLPFVEVAITQRELDSIKEREAREDGRKPGKAAAPAGASRPPVGMKIEPPPLAPFFPPFYDRIPLIPTPDGRVLVHRMATADSPGNRYDLVNRIGQLDGQIILGENERIVGSGKKHIYVVETDDDGVLWLRRHPWPPR
jgi:hypothetical protein